MPLHKPRSIHSSQNPAKPNPTMNYFKSYGKIDLADQATLEARRKRTQRLSIISISTLVLVAIIVFVVCATKDGSDTTSNPEDHRNPFATSIKAICNSTLYRESCLATLSSLSNSTQPDPVQIFHLSVQAAINELAKASKHVQNVGVREALDKMSLAALSDCGSLIELAVDYLNDTVSSGDFSSDGVVDDLKTWLSAAITYEHTCIDGFANAASSLKVRIAELMRNSTELTSNSLAILSGASDYIGSMRLRRLMSHEPEESPLWASHHDRRLLESSDELKRNADAVVDKDGSGKHKTITAALAKVPEKSEKRFVIYVKKGIYYENVRVEKNKWNVVMVGDGMDATTVSGSLNFVDGTPTYSTATFAVFGKGFVARDMGFRNTAGPHKHQAVALLSASDRSVFYRCRFDAFQDTLYAHSLRQFYRECNIYGTVDFIFGNAAVVFQRCNILPRVPMPGQQDTITAQGKADPNQNTGISIHNCTVWPYGDLSSVMVYLGRPWKPYSTTVFMRTMMNGFIARSGWMPWNGTTAPETIFYSEFQNFGAGAVVTGRVKWTGLRAMDSKRAAKFTVGEFLGGSSWISKGGVPHSSGL